MLGRILAVLLWPVFWFVFPLRLRASVIIVVGQEVLAVKHRIYFNKWSLPGGGVKLNEQPEAAAIRELKEELGIEIKQNELKALNDSFKLVKEYGIISRHKFFLFNPDIKPDIKINHEISEFRWFNISSDGLGLDVKQAIKLL